MVATAGLGQRSQRADSAGGQHDVIGKPATNLAIMEAAPTHSAIGGGQQVNRAGMEMINAAVTAARGEFPLPTQIGPRRTMA